MNSDNTNSCTSRIETITPDKAKELLERFPMNRKSSYVRIDSYAEIMRKGNWAPFSSIVIDECGNTVDGHHRLEAVIKSGVSVKMNVIRGLERRFVPFIDTGRPRSSSDMISFLEISKELNSVKAVASISRSALYYYKGNITNLISPDEIVSFIEKNMDEIEFAYNDLKMLRNAGGVAAHAAAVLILRLAKKNLACEIDKFVEQIAFGENIKRGMPAYAARSAMIATKGGGLGSAKWVKSFYTILRAWSAEREGISLDHIKIASVSLQNVLDINID